MEKKDELNENINNLDYLKEYISKLEDYELPEYKALSEIPLYMEQVISYIQGALAPLIKDSNFITPFMVNNYVKAKILDAPINKKYNKDHIAYLLAISLLKQTASMKDIASLIEIDKYLTEDKQKLYTSFKEIYDEVLKNQTHRLKVRVETISRDQKKKVAQNNKKTNKKEATNTLETSDQLLALIALRLYIESETSKMIADEIMGRISPMVFENHDVLEVSKKEAKISNKKESKEAKRLASRK